jgi:transposase-like protein
VTGVEWGVIVVGLVGGLGGLGALLDAFFRRGKNRADVGKANAEASTVITNTAMEWIQKFEEQAEAATETADRAQQQARELQQQLDALSRDARALAGMLAEIRAAILHPDASLDGLRDLVNNAHRE